MNLKYLLLLSLLFSQSCSLSKQPFENEYLKLTLPDSWKIIEKDNSEDSRWLVSTLIPMDARYLNDSINEAPVQNFIVIAIDSVKMASEYGPTDFHPYCEEIYERQKARGIEVSKFDTTELKGKKTYYWISRISREDKDPIVQEYYMVQLPPYYVSFQLTHSFKGKITDSNKILNSIEFKK